MKLNDLIDALAAEIEAMRRQLDRQLDILGTGDPAEDAFTDALVQYSDQLQRMGEAAEMAGFPGIQSVCTHLLENLLLLPVCEAGDRAAIVAFLRGWPPLIVFYLRDPGEPSAAAGVVDHLVRAPQPLDAEAALRLMHMLGALPAQASPAAELEAGPARPAVARPEDVALQLPEHTDPRLLEGFLQEAPDQARQLVALVHAIAGNRAEPADIVTAKRVVHTLKGSGSIIGLTGLATLGHHFEDILEHCERQGGRVAPAAAQVLVDAAHCLDQMVAYVTGMDDHPGQAQGVLQRVLDLANRIDRGESLDHAMLTAPPPASVPLQEVEVRTQERPAMARAENALRVSLERIEDLFRVSGEVSVHSAAMEARIQSLAQRSRDLLEQNLRVQRRLFELETVVDVRALTMMRARTRRTEAAAFDPLEMDQYSELHGTTHALVEEAADARALAQRLQDELSALASTQVRQQQLAKDLQHLVLGTRMSAAATLEPRLQRNVRSTAQATGKQAELILLGGDTLIDTDIVNRLAEPLLHLLRNAVDHGIEAPDARRAAGKPEQGRIVLAFARQGQQVVLRCEDDGAGLDLEAIRRRAIERGLVEASRDLTEDEIARLILLPGFSTRQAVSEISGRGVGLDVVRDWIASMNGSIRIAGQRGEGCTLELRFAASLASVHSLIVEAGGERYAIPSVQVEQAVPRGMGAFSRHGDMLVFSHGSRRMQASHLAQLAGAATPADEALGDCDVVVVVQDAGVRAIAVDRLLDSRDLLVKAPDRYAKQIRGVAGLSVLGDGSIAVNLDLAQLDAAPLAGAAQAQPRAAAAASAQALRVLVVDDAITVRNSIQQLVEDAGYKVKTARDGLDAVQALAEFRPDLVLTDLEMPNMNGVELTAHLRNRPETRDIPIVMITSRSQDKHRRMAEQAGVSTYLTKPYNDPELLRVVRAALA